MCGLAGIFLFDNGNKQILQEIRQMTNVLSHRGPNDEGYFVTQKIALGHRRLSIIDLSDNGKQPMFNEDKSIVMICNGEIYNFKELRKLLSDKGHIFKSFSDNEVVIHLYEEYGEQCVQYLEGMFAFAIYDTKKESLFLARDRIGEKPLFYFKDQHGFYFSSEIKSFYNLKNFTKRISAEGFHAYFNYIQIPSPQSIFNDVNKIRPAHWFTINAQGIETTSPYWNVSCVKKMKSSIKAAKDDLKELMLESVKSMLVSDVPVGILLSGGIDSSLILSLAMTLGRDDIKTFTVGNVDSKDNEYLRARKIAKHYNVENYVYNFSQVNFEDLVTAVKQCDEPIGILEIFYMFGIFKHIKKHVKVILTGNGADEIFAGYSSYNRLKQISNYTHLFKSVIERNNNIINYAAAKLNLSSKGKILKKLFSEEIKYSFLEDSSIKLLTNSMNLVSYNNLLDAKLFMDLFVLCNHGLTGISDIGGMAQSIEVRSPFLHHKVIEFAATLPANLKVKTITNPFYNKLILKELACDFYEREDVFVQKYGYGYFINAFSLIEKNWRKDVEETIFDTSITKSGLFNMNFVKEFWQRFLAQKLAVKERLIFARFILFCVWYKYSFIG